MEPQLRRLPPGRMLRERLQADHLVRNSLYLILNSGLQAALGFIFWIVAARLFTIEDVGKASSLIAATAIIAYIALLGLNSTFMRYLPTAPDRDALLTAGLLLVAASGTVIGLIYVFLTPVIAPRLAFVEHRPALAAGFILLAAAATVNLATDSIFIASRKAGYNALVDGGIGGITKIALAAMLVGTGAYGLFCASAVGFAAAALASVLLMSSALHYRPSFRKPFRTLVPLLRFSSANYAGNVLNLLPTLIVPLIALDRLGASAAAYYFIAFQMANLLYSAAYAVEQTFLAEGSQAGADWHELLPRSLRVLMALCLPACVILVVAAHLVLSAFGTKYSQHGAPALMVLAVAAIPLAANSWLQTVLRLAGRLRAIVVSNGVYAIAICGLAWILAPHGLTGLATAWPIGGLLGAAATAAAAAAAAAKESPRRHLRTARRWSNSVRTAWLGHREPRMHRWWAGLSALTAIAVGVSLVLPPPAPVGTVALPAADALHRPLLRPGVETSGHGRARCGDQGFVRGRERRRAFRELSVRPQRERGRHLSPPGTGNEDDRRRVDMERDGNSPPDVRCVTVPHCGDTSRALGRNRLPGFAQGWVRTEGMPERQIHGGRPSGRRSRAWHEADRRAGAP